MKREIISQYCNPARKYTLKINRRNTIKRGWRMFKINNTGNNKSTRMTLLTSNNSQSHRSVVFIVNFEHISQIFLLFLSLN